MQEGTELRSFVSDKQAAAWRTVLSPTPGAVDGRAAARRPRGAKERFRGETRSCSVAHHYNSNVLISLRCSSAVSVPQADVVLFDLLLTMDKFTAAGARASTCEPLPEDCLRLVATTHAHGMRDTDIVYPACSRI